MSSEHPSMPTVLPRVAATLALIALGGVAGILLDGVVAGSSTVVTGFVAATLAAVVATIVMLPGRSLHPAIAAAVVGGSAIVVAIGVAATEPARSPQRSPIAAALDAMANGWAAILRSPVPADAEPRILVPLALLVFSATATAITLERRTASSAAALLAPLAAIVLTAVAAGGRQDHPLLTGLGILVAIGVFLFARSTVSLAVPTLGATHRTTDYQWAMAASLAIVAVVGATLVGPQLALDRDPFDPRDHVEAPVAPAAATSPLDLVSSRHRQNDTVMFSVDSDVPLNTRLAAVEGFDGVLGSLAGPF